MSRPNRQLILAITFSVIMVMSMVAPFAGSALAMGDEPTETPQSLGSGDVQLDQQNVNTVEIQDNLSVWDRVPLRPATVDRAGGATSVDTPTSFLEDNSGDILEISTEQEAIFSAGDTVSLDLAKKSGANTEKFDGKDFQVLVAQFDGDRDTVDTLADLEDGEDGVSFKSVNAGEINGGEASASVNLAESGSYLLIGHVGGEVLEDGADQPSFNDTTVIGLDAVAAQETASSVDIETTNGAVELGDNVSVTADSNLQGNNVSHAVAVFDEKTFSEQQVNFNLTEDVSQDLQSEDVIIESDIAGVQGVADIQPNAQVSNTALTVEQFSGTVDLEEQSTSFFDLRNALVDDFGVSDRAGDAAEFTATGDTTLSASVSARGNQDSTADIDVGTLEEWDAGEYTVLHVATDQETGNISTVSEDVTLVEDVGEVDPDPNDVSIDNPAVNETEIEEGDTVQVSADVTNDGPVPITVTATVTIDGTPSTDPALTQQVTIAPGATETVTFDVLRNTAGEYSLGIQLDYEGDEIGTVTAPETVVVSEPPRRGGGGGGGGAPAPPSDGDGPDLPDPPADVNVTLDENAEFVVDPDTGASTARFSEANNVESVTFGFSVSGSVNARNLDREPDETGPQPGSSAQVSQITVSETIQNSDATLGMRISKDRIDEIGADAEDLRVNRYNDAEGEWQGLDTEIIGETDTHVRVEAETPGFSFFGVSAVSEPTADIDAPDEVAVGEEATFDGSGSDDEYGEIVAYDWDAAGTTLTGETVSTSFDEPGEVTVELTVENDAGETNTETATVSVTETDETVPGDDDETPTLIIVLIVFIALLVGTGAALYVRNQNIGNEAST